MYDPIMARRLTDLRQLELKEAVEQSRAVNWSLIDLLQQLTQVAHVLIAGRSRTQPKQARLSATQELHEVVSI